MNRVAPHDPPVAAAAVCDSVAVRPEDFGYSRFAVRIWHGMCLGAWLRLMRGNLGMVDPARYGLLVSVTACAAGNSVLKALSRVMYGRRVSQVTVSPAPLFVLGHWRSGTTWLNQLLSLDDRLAGPTAMQCFMPETFLIAQKLLTPLIRLLVPRKRPMDNVALRVDSSEEDEIALLLMGATTPYRRLAFPMAHETLRAKAIDGLTADELGHWRASWMGFLRAVQFVNPGRRLILKSPQHTTRIAEILRQFPEARFVHIVRDPYQIIPSHLNSSIAMTATQGFQARVPGPSASQDMILRDFVRFHETFHRQRGMIPDGNIVTIRYESLRRDPVATLRAVYRALDLGDFEPVRPVIEADLRQNSGYRTNAFDLSVALERKIGEQAQDYFDRYGYPRRGNRDGAKP